MSNPTVVKSKLNLNEEVNMSVLNKLSNELKNSAVDQDVFCELSLAQLVLDCLSDIEDFEDVTDYINDGDYIDAQDILGGVGGLFAHSGQLDYAAAVGKAYALINPIGKCHTFNEKPVGEDIDSIVGLSAFIDRKYEEAERERQEWMDNDPLYAALVEKAIEMNLNLT